jgi:tRNA threonylcarbamoyl adenosine modification protein YeaZ
MLKRVLEVWGLPLSKLSHCAVTVGPGSFTGVRIGLSAAKALGLALDIPVYGLSTLSAYSAPYREKTPHSYDFFFTLLDARHGGVFLAGYESTGEIVCPPSYVSDAKAAEILSLNPGRLFLTGSGAPKVRELLLEREHITVVQGDDSPPIEWVARLSCHEEERLAPAPVYLREPDAKIPKSPMVGGFGT